MHHKADTMDTITFDQSPVAELADNNNNQKNEIYSLRQRKQRRTKGAAANAHDGLKKVLGGLNVAAAAVGGGGGAGKKRGEGKTDKPKAKAAPLSKYRRKTANARERTRMREINCAFEHLRQCVPVSITGVETPSTNEKLTKITTLRLAMKYIRILSEILAKSSNCDGVHGGDPSANSFNYQDIYNDILNDTLFKPTVTKPSGGRKELKKQNAPPPPPKVKKTNRTRRKYTKQPKAVIKAETVNSCFAPPMMLEAAMDFGIMLESDGESLQLSEPCLSPLEQQIKFNPSSLELGLLLESDGESLELSEPCLSPLSHLDSLNPFSDLLPAGFTDQSIDIFLS